MRPPADSGNQYFTATLQSGPLRNVVNATGVVQTLVTVQVGSQVSGQVDEIYADFNSVVKRGQLLAKLDPRNFQSQVENARANVAAAQARVRSGEAEQNTQAANLLSAKANLEAARVTRDNSGTLFQRASGLRQDGLVSQNDFDNAKANADSSQAKYDQAAAAVAQVEAQSRSSAAQLEQVRAQLQQAEADQNRASLNLEYTNIYSPVDGVVISRNVDVGQTIAASMQAPTLFTIANDLTRMQVHANVDEADIGSISEQARVDFTVDAYPNDVFRGQIVEIRLSPQTVQNVVTYSVILGIENSELKLKPGMTANITITVDERANVLKVPNSALRYTPPNMQREEIPARSEPASIEKQVETAEETPASRASAADATKLAPGQKWDPSQKIRLVQPKRTSHRPAVVWVLNAEKKPESRRIVLGITDGVATEVVEGDLKTGDTVIVGDSTQGASIPPGNAPQPGFGFGLRGGRP
jgi:HlyD family secretion protein